jgi:methyl-accepting chemotaxis protein
MFRRNYMVKPALQLKYLAFGIVGVIVTGFCVYLTLDISIVHSERLSQLSQGELDTVVHAMQISFVWVLAILVLGTVVAGVLIFHRLIGPMYAVEKVLRMVADGDLTVYMPLRRGDELREVADAVEQMVGGTRRRLLRDKEHVVACQNKLRQLAEANPNLKTDLDALAAKLDRVGEEFRLG